MVDFTECKRIFGRAFNGANGKKIAIEYEGCRYMLKFPPSGKDKPTDLSYTNSCISEHIASSIFHMLGIPTQRTMLGTFKINGREKIVCACKDFTAGGKILYDFCSIKNSVIDSEHNGSGTELIEILEAVEKQQFVEPEELLEYFWDMFVADALLGNFDRHNGNWGFLVDPISQKAELAPVYDCGSCLLPQADETVMKKVVENERELNARIYQFPTSAIKQNGKKIHYYDFLIAAEYKECNKSLCRVFPRINMADIRGVVENVPYISELQKEFYKVYIGARYEKILKPAYEGLLK